VDVFTFIGARNEEDRPRILEVARNVRGGAGAISGHAILLTAKILFSRFLEFYPDDLLAKMYLNRALEYEQAPPDEAWEAVEVFEKK
jgi:hypothetical protein